MPQKRRGRGEGSIWQTDGVWFAEVIAGYGQHGAPLKRRVQAKTRTAVAEKLRRLQEQATTGVLPDRASLTVRDYLARWLHDTATSRRAKTQERYEGLVRLHILPVVGGVTLAKLQPLHVRSIHTRMREAGQKPASVLQAHAVLHRALVLAVREGYVPRNVCDAVERPKRERKTMRALSVEEALALEAAAEGDRLGALYVVALRTGMRQGELLALRWQDVDLTTATVTVRASLQEVGGKLTIVEPKTTAGRRRVEVDARCVAALRAHRERMFAEGLARPDAFVFCEPDGTGVRKSTARSSFKSVRTRAGIGPSFRFHDMRHTHASIFLAANVHPKIVQERLGHANVSITLDTYSHVAPTLHRDAVDKVAALLER